MFSVDQPPRAPARAARAGRRRPPRRPRSETRRQRALEASAPGGPDNPVTDDRGSPAAQPPIPNSPAPRQGYPPGKSDGIVLPATLRGLDVRRSRAGAARRVRVGGAGNDKQEGRQERGVSTVYPGLDAHTKGSRAGAIKFHDPGTEGANILPDGVDRPDRRRRAGCVCAIRGREGSLEGFDEMTFLLEAAILTAAQPPWSG